MNNNDPFNITAEIEKILMDIDLALPVTEKSNSSGMSCIKCKEFNQYAEPNQKDHTYKCWSCRNGL